MDGWTFVSQADLDGMAELQADLKKENGDLRESQRGCYERERNLTLEKDALQRANDALKKENHALRLERDVFQRQLVGGQMQFTLALNAAKVRIAHLEAKLRAGMLL